MWYGKSYCSLTVAEQMLLMSCNILVFLLCFFFKDQIALRFSSDIIDVVLVFFCFDLFLYMKFAYWHTVF